MAKLEIKNKNNAIIGYSILDKDDFKRAKQFRWSMHSGGYCQTRVNGKLIKLHQFILGKKQGYEIDHFNGNKLDNRKQNLRFCTKSQNQFNCGPSKRNTSGLRGVSWHKKAGKWQARFRYNYEYIWLGLFNDKQEAGDAVKRAIKVKLGNFEICETS